MYAVLAKTMPLHLHTHTHTHTNTHTHVHTQTHTHTHTHAHTHTHTHTQTALREDFGGSAGNGGARAPGNGSVLGADHRNGGPGRDEATMGFSKVTDTAKQVSTILFISI